MWQVKNIENKEINPNCFSPLGEQKEGSNSILSHTAQEVAIEEADRNETTKASPIKIMQKMDLNNQNDPSK